MLNFSAHIKNSAEELPGKIIPALLKSSTKQKVTIIAGSIPEKCDEKILNTCFVIEKDQIINRYRKVRIIMFIVSKIYLQT